MSKLFEELKKGLENAIAHKQGKLNLRSTVIEVPEPPAEYQKKDIKRIRTSISVSQGLFAKFLNVSVKTVQSWEAGERKPSHAALRLIELVDKGIYLPNINKKK